MHWVCYIYSLSCLFIGALGVTELHSSTIHLLEGLVTESLAFEDLSRFLLSEELRLKKHIAEFEAISVPPWHNDPLTKFFFASRLDGYREKLTEAAVGAESDEILRTLINSETFWTWWPMGSDLVGASEGLCKLQQVYDVPVQQMVSMRSDLLPPPSPDDLKDVARGCFAEGPFGNTSTWSTAALQRMRQWTDVLPPQRRKFQMGIASLVANDIRREALQANEGVTTYPSPPSNDMMQHKSICVRSGDVWPQQSDLVCEYSVNGGHPYLLLQPLKVEFLSYDPRIVVIHDFLRPSESEVIQNMGAKTLTRGTVYSEEKPSGVHSPLRVSKVSWLSDSEHPLLAKLTTRIAAATWLSLESAELYQVANYGLGGHYTPHPDAKGLDDLADDASVEDVDGNRLATMLLFLSDVPAGGATAFVDPPMAVKPREGDALFWFDLRLYAGDDWPQHFDFWHEKRVLDERTWHTGCPVLRGSKWIATKWIHERDNVHVDYNVPA
ncbi:prolyl 4-hydroxylase subunit alpha-3-like [Dermacentor albipictus]|uniref:prolyl 4-hydroxylase subunit alpha-3-like n=1 Tax=Dermacentor albipictus TaxID=60249 RepID=UPI0038FD16B7